MLEEKETVTPSIPHEVIEAIGKIEEPTFRQQLVIDELTHTFSPELGPILAKELAESVREEESDR